ncbi:CAP domain-containing protein [Cyathus striatus]|nr:CAP domain-containing protein [Cyathus striatus]
MQLKFSLFTAIFLALSAVVSVFLQNLRMEVASLSQNLKVEALSFHNSNRKKYGASALKWNASLYQETFSDGGKYGENLGAGTGDYGIQSAVHAWMAEAPNYNYINPGFSSATGHFAQVVWKSTTSVVACAIASCPAGTIFNQASKYVVCRYAPPGNYRGQFPNNQEH